MNLCSIASGSSGNCIYVGSHNTHVMIDAGISKKRIEQGLNSIGLKASEIDGILITHEHSDHIGGLGVLARRYGIPMYGTKGTIEGIKKCSSLGKIPQELFYPIDPNTPFFVKELLIKPVKISHDAREPVAYRIEHGKKSVGVMTDLGTYDDSIIEHLKELDVLLLEANHDVNMLQVGKYPYPLKQRILGDRGHLSNERYGRLLCEIIHTGLKHIILGHLSKENNMAELAYETVRMELAMGQNPFLAREIPLTVARREECSGLVTA